MKVLFLTNKMPYPPRDGGSIATLNMMKGLSGSGNQVTCLSMNTTKHHFPAGSIPEPVRSAIRFIGVDCDTTLRPFLMLLNFFFSRRPYIAERFRSRAYRDRLRQLLGSERFQVVQMEGPYPGHYLADIRNISPSPVILRAHNVEHLIWERKARHERSPLKRWYLRNMASRLERFEMEVVRNADAVIAISGTDEDHFRNSGYRGSLLTLPAGLALEEYPYTPLPASPTIFFIGALDWLPNQEGLDWFLDQVFNQLAEEIPELRFHVAGRNAPGHLVRKLKRKNVEFHGEVVDAKQFMNSFRVMVAPLLTGSGMRIKIIEAMALGRPVVTTPEGIDGIPATAQKEVLVSGDPHLFREEVARLLLNDRAAEKITAEARKLVSRNFDAASLNIRYGKFLKSKL